MITVTFAAETMPSGESFPEKECTGLDEILAEMERRNGRRFSTVERIAMSAHIETALELIGAEQGEPKSETRH